MTHPLPAAAPDPAGIPPGAYLECPDCGGINGLHLVPHCRGVVVPKLPGGRPALARVIVTAGIPQVVPAPRSRLEQLRDMRDAARAAVQEAADQAALIDAGIKAELAAACPGRTVVDLAPGPGQKPLRLRYHPGAFYVPAAVLRDKYPAIEQELKTQKRGSWQLHDLDAGDE
jgi:hypothetical protein